jgi:hypothetical protein
MIGFLLTPRAIDWIIALVAVEALAILALRASGRGPAALPFAANLLSGAFLLLALRGALGAASPAMIGLCLSGALIAHIADLFSRWEGSAHPSQMRATLTMRASKPLVRPAPSARTDEPSDR